MLRRVFVAAVSCDYLSFPALVDHIVSCVRTAGPGAPVNANEFDVKVASWPRDGSGAATFSTSAA